MKYYVESIRTGISYIQYKEGRLTGLATSCAETAFWNTLLKEIYWTWRQRRRHTYWMIQRKREDTLNWKRKH